MKKWNILATDFCWIYKQIYYYAVVLMIKNPHISAADEKRHKREVVISLDGKVLAFGKNAIIAFKKAQKIIPDLDDKKILVSYILPKYYIG